MTASEQLTLGQLPDRPPRDYRDYHEPDPKGPHCDLQGQGIGALRLHGMTTIEPAEDYL